MPKVMSINARPPADKTPASKAELDVVLLMLLLLLVLLLDKGLGLLLFVLLLDGKDGLVGIISGTGMGANVSVGPPWDTVGGRVNVLLPPLLLVVGLVMPPPPPPPPVITVGCWTQGDEIVPEGGATTGICGLDMTGGPFAAPDVAFTAREPPPTVGTRTTAREPPPTVGTRTTCDPPGLDPGRVAVGDGEGLKVGGAW
jgi:hypothetical protein